MRQFVLLGISANISLPEIVLRVQLKIFYREMFQRFYHTI